MYIMIYNGSKWLKINHIEQLFINGEPYRGVGQVLGVNTPFILIRYIRITMVIPSNVFVLEEAENEVI